MAFAFGIKRIKTDRDQQHRKLVAEANYLSTPMSMCDHVNQGINRPLSTSTMVEIYLIVHGSQIPFLSIPYSDVQRLSICPFKWLHYVMFSICGTCGDLSATPEGSPVDYDSTELADNSIYFYKPLGKIFCCILYKIIVH